MFYKVNHGWITGKDRENKVDIVTNGLCRNNVTSILIGCGIAVAAIAYTGFSCFNKGARAFDLAEQDVLKKLDLITDPSNITET